MKARITLSWTVEVHKPSPVPFGDPDIVAACRLATEKLLLTALEKGTDYEAEIFKGAKYSITVKP